MKKHHRIVAYGIRERARIWISVFIQTARKFVEDLVREMVIGRTNKKARLKEKKG